MTKDEWYRQLFERLDNSKFRSSFHLKQKDIDYINEKGLDTLRQHAKDFIAKREAPAYIVNDGKQTPMRGHPVFIAQHATATCCRECIRKWHKMQPGKELSQVQQDYLVDVIMTWIQKEIERQEHNDMNIQIFGSKKCNDTKKAERFFKERGIKYQFIDMKEKGMSKGEFNSVAQANGGLENMVNWDGKDKDLLALIKYIADEDKLEKVLENPQVIKTPVVRNGKQSTLGYQPDIWKGWN